MERASTQNRVSAPMISVNEAHMMSGLSEIEVESLLAKGEVKGKKVNGSWKVYRLSLQAHLARLAKQAEGNQTNAGRVGASAAHIAASEAVEGTEENLNDEIWALRRMLEEERAALSAERSKHAQTLVTLAAAREEIQRIKDELVEMRFDMVKDQLNDQSSVQSAEAAQAPGAQDSVSVEGGLVPAQKPKVGFFQMLKRAFSDC